MFLLSAVYLQNIFLFLKMIGLFPDLTLSDTNIHHLIETVLIFHKNLFWETTFYFATEDSVKWKKIFNFTWVE